ncbi:MAG TPA: CoA transferase [Firmicutes bacterium]|nr:CoA transferase [Bacillota bacterium]
MRERKGILEGVRVIGFEQQVAAPYCTMMLADAGAEVIKVERPGIGDPAREMAPILKGADGNRTSGYFLRFNRNKKSVTVDIQKEEGKALFKDMVAKADILVENFRPGVMEENGLGYDVLKGINPGLIYVAISGFGRLPKYRGVYSDRPAYDIVAQAMGGLMHLAGEKDGPPTWLGTAVGDIVTGMIAAYACLLGLIKKARTGKGEFIDIAMYDCMVALGERAISIYSLTGQILSRGRETLIAPWGPFKAKDGWIALMVPTESMWARFCKAIGREDLLQNPELSSGPGRAKHKDDILLPVINEWLKDKTREEAVSILLEKGLPAGPVQNAEDIFNCPHIKARELMVEVPDPVIGSAKLVGSPVKFSEVELDAPSAAPRLGEHTEEVLKEVLGYDADRIRSLKDAKVI